MQRTIKTQSGAIFRFVWMNSNELAARLTAGTLEPDVIPVMHDSMPDGIYDAGTAEIAASLLTMYEDEAAKAWFNGREELTPLN